MFYEKFVKLSVKNKQQDYVKGIIVHHTNILRTIYNFQARTEVKFLLNSSISSNNWLCKK